MLRRGLLFVALCLVPALAYAQPAKGPFELELGGTGTNGPNFNGFSASANGSFGYYFNDVVELSIRQSAAYNDIGGVGWNASTRVSIDWNFPLGDTGAFTPFIGVNGGYAYGTHGLHNWEAAPEAGLKYYINGSTFIFGSIEYQFFVDQHSSNTNTFSNRLSKGEFIYGLGIGVRF